MLTNEEDPDLKINQIRISMSYIINNMDAANARAQSQAMADKVTFTVTS